jgi:hypothetical protein
MYANERDTVTVHVNRETFRFRHSQGDPLNDQIVDAVHRMTASGIGAEAGYRAAIVRLRAQVERAIEIVGHEYHDLDENRYLDRWALVQVMSDLWHPAALPVLDAILSSRMPPERSDDLHDSSTVDEELMIRTSAVDAITRLAAQGNREARGLLRQHLGHPAFSVRRAAVQGYLASGDESTRAELRRILPAHDQVLLRIVPLQMSQIPVPRGDLDLVGVDRTLPAPDLPDPNDPDADYAPPGTPAHLRPRVG